MQKIDVNLFRNACAFTLTMRRFSNRRQGDLSKVDVDADKRRFRLSKQLIDSPEYDSIVAFQSQTYQWCTNRSVPSYFKDGLYLVKLSEVDALESRLRAAVTRLQAEFVPKLMEVYPDQVELARQALNGQFKPSDYPPVQDLPNRFGILWNWISFGVPENLPEELRKAEAEKIQKQFREAEIEITAALRDGFAEIVARVTDRLTVAAGEKPKIFRDTLFEQLTTFIETFSARNLVEDNALEELVTRAKAILSEVNGSTPFVQARNVRDSAELRSRTAEAFNQLRSSVINTIINRPTRKFDFTE
jgi:hypothetical protein